MDIVIGILVFLAVMLTVGGIYSLWMGFQRERILRRLSAISEGQKEEEVSVIQVKALSGVPWLNNLLLRLPGIERMAHISEQAAIRQTLGFFILLSLFLGCVSLYGGYLINKPALGILGAPVLGLLPYFYILHKKRRRMHAFGRQLPEALELLSRALRAGHAFPAGLKIVSDEFSDPMGTEFGKVFDEINFGTTIPKSLTNLAHRLDCEDLQFLIISVIVQKETGGNLAEILENTSSLIRRRFELLGRVRALSAEGRMSAWMLSILPFLLALGLFIINRAYITLLVKEPLGQKLMMCALIWLTIGIFLIKRMIKIKV